MHYVLMLIWIVMHAVVGTCNILMLPFWLSISLLSGGAVGYFYTFIVKHKASSLYRVLSMICILISTTGLAQWHAKRALDDVMAKRVNTPQSVEMIVYVDKMNQSSIDSQFYQQQFKVYRPLQHNQVTWQSLIPIKHYPLQTFKIGHYYKIKGQVTPIHGHAVASAFDLERFALQQNVMGQLHIDEVEQRSTHVVAQQFPIFVQLHQGILHRLVIYIEQQRFNYRQAFKHQSVQHKGLILALLTGDQSLLNNPTKQQFTALGLSHLLAISGPHILIFAVLLCFSLQRIIRIVQPTLYLKYPKPYVMMAPMLLAALFYGVFVGFEVPALRTWLTLLILSLSICFKYRLNALSVVLLSASILLLIDPLQVLSAAFWLSYIACFMLIRIYQLSKNIFQDQENKSLWITVKQLFLLSVWTQCQIFLALLPITLFYFHQFSWLAPLANLIAIPYLSLIVIPLSIVAGVLFVLQPTLANFIWCLVGRIIDFMLFMLDVLERLAVQMTIPAWNVWQIMALAVAILILFLPRGCILKSYALIAFVIIYLPSKKADYSLHILDVGQGQAIFVRTAHHHLMIDLAGQFPSSAPLAEQVLFPFLIQQGVKQFDLVVLTHHDLDHSGSFPHISQKIPFRQVISNEYNSVLFPEQSKFSFCHAGQSLRYDDLNVQFLYPLQPNHNPTANSKNESSCVVYLNYQYTDHQLNVLIMGDTGKNAEQVLMTKYPKLPVDILVLAHHGSRFSSSTEFLKHYHPQVAIASAGYQNRYGHPHQEVRQRLENLRIPLWVTSETGSIQITPEEKHPLQPRFYRDEKLWLR